MSLMIVSLGFPFFVSFNDFLDNHLVSPEEEISTLDLQMYCYKTLSSNIALQISISPKSFALSPFLCFIPTHPDKILRVPFLPYSSRPQNKASETHPFLNSWG